MAEHDPEDSLGTSDQDSPWKEALEHYLEPALALLFPQIHERVDWARGFTFRDKELQQVVRDAEAGRRYADKLVEVYVDDGEPTWVLLHVEVQGEPEAAFAERMFTYHYRLYDRYQRAIVSLAVLTDASLAFRPDTYRHERLGCGLQFWFPMVKLLDWQQRWSELEADPNPFACVVLAQLAAKGERDPQQRKAMKLRLTRLLLDRGYNRAQTQELLRLLDWFMQLPTPLEAAYHTELHELEEEYKMPFVTSFERAGEERGRQETEVSTLLRQIELKFGEEVKEAYRDRVEKGTAEDLESWLDRIIIADRIDQVFADD